MTTATIIKRYKRADDWDDLTPNQQKVLVAERVHRNTYAPETPWSGEIWDSYNAIMAAANIDAEALRYGYEGGTLDLSGPRALAWLENQIVSPVRVPYGPAHYVRYRHAFTGELSRLHRTGVPGTVICPFTGVYSDDVMLDAMADVFRQGGTVRDALKRIAGVAEDLIQAEIDAYTSESYAEESLRDEGPWEWITTDPESITAV